MNVAVHRQTDEGLKGLAITPESLVDLLRVTAPEREIVIQGIAEEVKPWTKGSSHCVYGRLVLGGASVRFRAPTELAPRNGEAVFMQGTLTVKSAQRRPGEPTRITHEVLLSGGVVGVWHPRMPASISAPVVLNRTTPRISLRELATRNQLTDLVVLCTVTAQRDLEQSYAKESCSVPLKKVPANFGDAESFVATLRSVLEDSSVRAIAIARGGGSGLDVIGGSEAVVAALIDSGLPFYTAIGHAADIVRLDRLADESLHTPSALGTAIAQAHKSAERDRESQAELQKLRKKVREYERQEVVRGHFPAGSPSPPRRVSRHGVVLDWKGLVLSLAVAAIAGAVLVSLL